VIAVGPSELPLEAAPKLVPVDELHSSLLEDAEVAELAALMQVHLRMMIHWSQGPFMKQHQRNLWVKRRLVDGGTLLIHWIILGFI
jgi:hypothetical protein